MQPWRAEENPNHVPFLVKMTFICIYTLYGNSHSAIFGYIFLYLETFVYTYL